MTNIVGPFGAGVNPSVTRPADPAPDAPPAPPQFRNGVRLLMPELP